MFLKTIQQNNHVEIVGIVGRFVIAQAIIAQAIYIVLVVLGQKPLRQVCLAEALVYGNGKMQQISDEDLIKVIRDYPKPEEQYCTNCKHKDRDGRYQCIHPKILRTNNVQDCKNSPWPLANAKNYWEWEDATNI